MEEDKPGDVTIDLYAALDMESTAMLERSDELLTNQKLGLLTGFLHVDDWWVKCFWWLCCVQSCSIINMVVNYYVWKLQPLVVRRKFILIGNFPSLLYSTRFACVVDVSGIHSDVKLLSCRAHAQVLFERLAPLHPVAHEQISDGLIRFVFKLLCFSLVDYANLLSTLRNRLFVSSYSPTRTRDVNCFLRYDDIKHQAFSNTLEQ